MQSSVNLPAELGSLFHDVDGRSIRYRMVAEFRLLPLLYRSLLMMACESTGLLLAIDLFD